MQLIVPAPAPAAPPASASLRPQYKVFVKRDRFRNRQIDAGTQASGVTWDDARELCLNRGANLARVFSAEEQVLLTQEVVAAHHYEIEWKSKSNPNGAGSEIGSVWLAGYRPEDPITGAYAWQWAPTEGETAAGTDPLFIEDQNSTFWSPDGPDYKFDTGTYGAPPSAATLAYAYINGLSFEWGAKQSKPGHASSTYAYACEYRGEAPLNTFQRLDASPEIHAVTPQYVLPGEVLRINGTHLDAGFDAYQAHAQLDSATSDTKANQHNATLSVSVAGRDCPVRSWSADSIECVLQAGTPAGVYPVRVTTPLGLAGPARLPLVNVEYEILSISPVAGSFGGGQRLTVTGVNLPTEKHNLHLDLELHWDPPACAISVNATHNKAMPCTQLGTHISEIVHCEVVSLTTSEAVCETGPISGVTEHILHKTGNLNFSTHLVPTVMTSGDGDMIRIVSQYQYQDFSAAYSPGIYVANTATGLDYKVPGSDWLASPTHSGWWHNRISAQVSQPKIKV